MKNINLFGRIALVLSFTTIATHAPLHADCNEDDQESFDIESLLAPVSEIECGTSKSVTVPLNEDVCQDLQQMDEPGVIYNCDDTLLWTWESMCPDVLDRAAVVERTRLCGQECTNKITNFYRQNYAFTCKKPKNCPPLSTCQKRVGGGIFGVCYGAPTTSFGVSRLGGGRCQARCYIKFARKLIGNFNLTRSCDDCVPM